MPNHVTNIVTFIGAPERVNELRKKCRGEGKDKYFSFNAFLPMPVELEGTTSPAKIVSEKELQAWNDKLAKGELKEWEKDSRPITEAQSREYILKYGTNNWYDWHIHNWGTKWDCYSQIECSIDKIQFDTAWGTPVKALLELSRQFPDVTIKVEYADEDFGCNVGFYFLDEGHVTEEYAPEFGKESIEMAIRIHDDEDYWLGDRLSEISEDEFGNLEQLLLEIAHDRGCLYETYPNFILNKLLELAIEFEEYERAKEIKELLKETNKKTRKKTKE